MISNIDIIRKQTKNSYMRVYTKKYTKYLKYFVRKVSREMKKGFYKFVTELEVLDEVEIRAIKDVLKSFTEVGYGTEFCIYNSGSTFFSGNPYYSIRLSISWEENNNDSKG